MRLCRYGLVAFVVAASGSLVWPASTHAALTKAELKCSATVAKSYAKLQSSILKELNRCHVADITGKEDSPDGCATLSSKAQAKIDKAKEKLIQKVAKTCKSVCQPSNDIECVTDLNCPPTVASAERCLGKNGANPFSLRNLDWPGPYCDSILGHSMTTPEDLGECLVGLVDRTALPVDEHIFADLDETSLLGKETTKCLSSISKAVDKAMKKAYPATASCRDQRRSDDDLNVPAYACASQDADAIADIDKAVGKMTDLVGKKCTDADIADLTGLCAVGGTPPATVADAQACLSDMVREIATEERGYNRHVWSGLGMLNATHPRSAYGYCGDGVVSPWREEHTGIGEECDGDADDACGLGDCLPPGDVFECTCDTTPRERFVVNGDISATDSDAGWLGTSHEATHNDGFGYLTELSNCSCDAFTGADCTTPSGDDICDIYGNMAPRCSDDLNGTETCDDRGNGNGFGENRDCLACDANSINAGDWCGDGLVGNGYVNESACQSQCFDNETGLAVMPQAPCASQGDCGPGETCKGRCDGTITCNKMTDGSPLPLIAAANPVCISLEYMTDVTGTKNIVTGETETFYVARSLVSLGNVFKQPCPACGGVCVGGAADGDTCEGRCDVSDDPCILDADCTGLGDTACLETDDDCAGGTCSLDLRCNQGPNTGQLCRPDDQTPFGIVSHDCPGTPNETISGTGVIQDYGGFTTKAVSFPAGAPCTDPEYANFDCPCPADTPPNFGVPTGPNTCGGACDGGINAGKGCAANDGSLTGSLGDYTTCVGGVEDGDICDEDSDCDSNDCSGNPLQCTAGDANRIGRPCTVPTALADCGAGGVCSDACLGARCVPLCLAEGVCNGGARDGVQCATVEHCRQCTAGHPSLIGTGCDTHTRCDTTAGAGDGLCEVAGGVTCDLSDPEDGLCASGPQSLRCTGAGFTTVPCELHYGTCTESLCTKGSPSKRNQPCTVGSDCVDDVNVPVSSGCETGIDSLPGTADDIPGAGECEPTPVSCFYNNGFAEGGDTLNGQGSPTNVNINAAFCTPANSNTGVNAASGFGGPSRVRRQGTAFVNVPSIP